MVNKQKKAGTDYEAFARLAGAFKDETRKWEDIKICENFVLVS